MPTRKAAAGFAGCVYVMVAATWFLWGQLPSYDVGRPPTAEEIDSWDVIVGRKGRSCRLVRARRRRAGKSLNCVVLSVMAMRARELTKGKLWWEGRGP